MASRPIFDDIDYSSFESGDLSRQRYVGAELEATRRLRTATTLKLLPSQWVEHFVRIKDGDRGVVKKIDFKESEYLRRPYDTPSRSILFMTSRQTEKSTTIGNKMLSLSGMRRHHTMLFVSPSAMQTKVFSTARLDDIIEISPLVKALTHEELTKNLLEKEFLTQSKIYLRYAFLNADRIRGLSVNSVFCDEVQDLLKDVMPVIQETASHSMDPLYCYSGTPKTLDNTIEGMWAKESTQSEWCIPCDRHGTPNKPGTWHWVVLGPKNIGKTGPICEKCGRGLNPEHPMARWVAMNPKAEMEGFRICRLMVPWYWKPNRDKTDPHERWRSIVRTMENYPTAQFMNEVMALSYDSGVKPLTRGEMISACDETNTYLMDEDQVAELGKTSTLYGGIDWGCHDDQTRILTTRGFVFFKDLTDDDLVAQWDPETREMTFVKPKARTVRDWDQPLHHYTTRGGVDLMVTHTHRMRVKADKWTTEPAADTALRGGPVNFVGHVRWGGKEVDTFVLPGLSKSPGYAGCEDRVVKMDDWLEFMGYLITEGGVCRDGDRFSCLKMSQRLSVNATTAHRIEACMDRLGISYTPFPNEKTTDLNWTIYGKQYWDWYAREIGATSDTKRLPRWVFGLSSGQLRILFDAMVDGDGSRDDRPGCTGGSFYSTSRGLCEDFQEICIRLGLRCSVSLHKPAEGNHKTRWRAMFSAGRDHSIRPPKQSVKKVPYSGKVYCCAVDTGYIVTERNGKISYQGNTGEHSYTVLVVGGYVRDDPSFQILYAKRFDGPLVEPDPQMREIIRLINRFRLKYVGCDYGMGFFPNKKLSSIYSAKRIHQFQYAVRAPAKFKYKGALGRFLVYRTPVMSDIFSAIKNKKVRFPIWDQWKTPFGEDMLSIYAEYSDTMKMIKYDKPRGVTDDSFHAVLYTVLASFFDHRRPDIIAPIQETTTEEAGERIREEAAIEEIEGRISNDWGLGQDPYG